MQASLLDWLTHFGSQVFTVALWGFVLLNGAAIAAVFVTRDRSLVNRWTGRLLAANLVLVGGGLGVPLLASMARLAVVAVSPSTQVVLPVAGHDADEVQAIQEIQAKRLR